MAESGLPTGHNGRAKVDQHPRVLDHPGIHVAGDLASVADQRSGHVLPPLAHSTGGRLAHLLQDAIEWEYRQSVKHLRGWSPVAR